MNEPELDPNNDVLLCNEGNKNNIIEKPAEPINDVTSISLADFEEYELVNHEAKIM